MGSFSRCPTLRRKLTAEELQARAVTCSDCGAVVRVVPNLRTGEATIAEHGGRKGLQARKPVPRAPAPVRTVRENVLQELAERGLIVDATKPGPIIVSTTARGGAAPLVKTGTLDSRTLREWFKMQPCQLAGVEGHHAEFHAAGEPHHVTSRGRIGRQDLLVVGVCHEAHVEAHAGKISRGALKIAAYDALVFFIASADRETKQRVLREMFGEESTA